MARLTESVRAVRRSSVTGSALVGKYGLEVGAYGESSAQFVSTRSRADKAQARKNAAALRSVLSEPDTPLEPRTPVEAVETLEHTADAVTDRIEHANKLFKAVADHRLFDPNVLTGEISALLGLLDRLDHEGRYDEEIRLAKALHGLCVLAFRWLELLQSLRAALRAARVAGDDAGQSWALNELGTLHLCVGDPKKAEEYLEHALMLKEKLGDVGGRCVTRHNLDSARRDFARPVQIWAPRQLIVAGGVVGGLRRTPFLGAKLLVILALLLATPVVVGWYGHGGTGQGEATNPATSTPGGGPSGGVFDVALRDPGRYLRGSERLQATASVKGDRGSIQSIAFQRALGAGGEWTLIARDVRPPYEARLTTRTLSDGRYRLRVVANSNEGKLYPSAPVAVVIDNTPPTAQIVGNGFLRGDEVEIEVEASDALSGIDGTQVQYSESGEHTWGAVPSPWVTTKLGDGPYDLRVRATDRAGNEAKFKTVTRWVDNRDPDVEITAPIDFVNASDAHEGAYTVTAAAPARDVEQVEFFRCDDSSEGCFSNAWVSLGIDKASPYQASWKLDPDGNRALRVVGTDRASRQASDIVNVLIDRRPPLRGAAAAELVWDPEAVTYRIDVKIRRARDFGSGIFAGSEVIKRARGAWIVGVVGYCALEGEFQTLANLPPTHFLSDYKIERGQCYAYVYEVADEAGNIARFASKAVLVPASLG